MGLNEEGTWTRDDEAKFLTETQPIQDELNSEEIDKRMRYAKQIETVRGCLTEAFGEYASDIKIVNRFFLDLNFFMSEVNNLLSYKGEKYGEEYEKVRENAISGGNAIKGNIIDYGIEARKKMKADLLVEGKTEEEAKKIMKGRSDKFLSLLRERIKYEVK